MDDFQNMVEFFFLINGNIFILSSPLDYHNLHVHSFNLSLTVKLWMHVKRATRDI